MVFERVVSLKFAQNKKRENIKIIVDDKISVPLSRKNDKKEIKETIFILLVRMVL